MPPTDENPKARELADRYKQPYEDVVTWLAEDFTPPEIERACRLGDKMEAEPGDILAMLDAGLDWRAVERALRVMPDPDEGDEDDEVFGPARYRTGRR
jgi:hypothetical protein